MDIIATWAKSRPETAYLDENLVHRQDLVQEVSSYD
jgi:hypothetical protein